MALRSTVLSSLQENALTKPHAPTKKTEAERAAHLERLNEMRAATSTRIELATAEYEVLRDEGGDVGAGEDEGGGESDVTTTERDRIRAAIGTDTVALESIDAALERALTDSWNKCVTCGNEIGAARLEAIPSTDRCVTCKAAATSW